jgi:maspardin
MPDSYDATYPEATEPFKSQLRRFRQAHEPKIFSSNGSNWDYLTGGRGSETVLALHGGGGPAESLFRYIDALEGTYRVIAPTVPATVTRVEDVIDALLSVLAMEGASSVHLFGVSNGGMIGQVLLRRDPRKVRSLILFHSMLPNVGYGKRFRRRARVLSLIPRLFTVSFGLRWLKRQILSEAVNAAPGEQAFWTSYFSELYSSELMSKAFFVSRATILTDYFSNYRFEPGDLDGWTGKIFIIESENDQIVSANERQRLKDFYRTARVHTFRGAGHLGGGLFKVEETVELIREFLQGA